MFEIGKSYYATEMPGWAGTCLIVVGRNGNKLDVEWPTSGRPQPPFTVETTMGAIVEEFEHNGYHYTALNEW